MNVIWMVADTLRRDHIGAYGNREIHTPSLDALAAKSVRFDRYYAASFPTMPARADYFTGRFTVSFMQWERIPESQATLAEILAGNGINTAAVVDTPFYLGDDMNYDRGFKTYEEIPGQLPRRDTGVPRPRPVSPSKPQSRLEAECFAPQTFAKAMQWLERNYKKDFFLYIDTWDPHEGWNAPWYYTELYWPDYDGEPLGVGFGYWKDTPGMTREKLNKAHATYCGEVTMVDTWVGNLLRQVEYMGLMDNTAIIFTTDHGTHFDEHGGRYGKITFTSRMEPGSGKVPNLGRTPHYEEVIAVPLFIYVPGISPGTYSKLTSAIDLMPTVLDIIGQEIPSSVEGKSLLPKVKDTSLPGYEHVITSFSFLNDGDKQVSADGVKRDVEYDSMATVTTDEWSLLYDTKPGGSELYNLKSDPKQEKNVIYQHPDVARELHQLFVKHMRDIKVENRFLEKRLELRL